MTENVYSELNQQLSLELENGLVLNVSMQELKFTAYLVIGAMDLEQVGDIVPYDEYIKYNNLHVASIDHPQDTAQQLEDVSFNMDMNDGLVLFCADQASYFEAMQQLGYENNTIN